MYPLKGVPAGKADAYQKNILEKCKLIRPAYTLMMKNPKISKKQMTEILDITMYVLKKELAMMAEEHVADLSGLAGTGNGLCIDV